MNKKLSCVLAMVAFLSLFVAPGVVHAGDYDDALANFNAKNYALAAPLFDKAAKQNVDR
jgi:hypothetical protein